MVGNVAHTNSCIHASIFPASTVCHLADEFPSTLCNFLGILPDVRLSTIERRAVSLIEVVAQRVPEISRSLAYSNLART